MNKSLLLFIVLSLSLAIAQPAAEEPKLTFEELMKVRPEFLQGFSFSNCGTSPPYLAVRVAFGLP
jgi:hypothetical protein